MRAIFFLIFFPLIVHAKCVLVTGGAGYIGSHVNMRLNDAGYETIVLDNLSAGFTEMVIGGKFIKGDIADSDLLDQIFSMYKIDAVIHFAGYRDVGESMKEPHKYYQNNVAGTLSLLAAMLKHNVNVLIFSSSCTIFGPAKTETVDETHPCEPISPYGRSKLMVETILRDMDSAYGLRFMSLRYFNPAGGDDSGRLKYWKTKDSLLIPNIFKSMKKPGAFLTIFGTDYPTPDGTGIRDYIHIEDVSSAHIIAMEKLLAGAPSNFYNLGIGRGFSVREVISGVERVTGQKVPVIEGARRAGDPPKLVSNPSKAIAELGWHPQHFTIDSMIDSAWKALP